MLTPEDRPILTQRFEDALLFATRIHARDTRKSTRIPYVAHLLSVCATVLSDGGSENEAIAALLHDTLEDHPEDVSREVVSARFGPEVLSIVEGCTDTPRDYTGGAKPPWKERKLAYLSHIQAAGPDSARVTLADKLDNARAILLDLREVGDEVWKRFNAGRAEQLWYFRSLVAAFRAAGVKGRLLEELDRTVGELDRMVATRKSRDEN